MSRIDFDITGLRELAERLGRTRGELKKALSAAVKMAGENIRTESMRRTPVDLGVLRASHYVTDPEENNGIISVVVGCGGGPAAPYARIQHERLDLNHPEGEAKFLENAVKAEADNSRALLSRFTKMALERGLRGS